MSNEDILQLTLIVTVIVLYFVFKHDRKKKLNKRNLLAYVEHQNEEQKRREKLSELLNPYLDKILFAVQEYNKIVNSNIYITHSSMEKWLLEFKDLYNDTLKAYDKVASISNENHIAIQKFLNSYKSFTVDRIRLNDVFVEAELKYYHIFFELEVKPILDTQQRRAVIIDEDVNLVIAGAGTGKTTTIIGKLAYLKNKLNITPSQILALSFTKKSASDLSSSIQPLGFNASTFHSLGYHIINKSGLPKPDVLKDIEYSNSIIGILSNLLATENYKSSFLDYFIYFLKPYKEQDDFNSQIEYIEYLRAHDFKPFKKIPLNATGIISYKQDVVKSIEECMIANFLFFNGIEYKYEAKYPFQTDQPAFKPYRPDFTITQGNITVYLEHFALDKFNQVPSWFTGDDASEKYKDGIIWKKTTHAQNGTTLIETFSHEVSSNTIFKNLKDSLLSHGINLKPISNEEALAFITKNAKREYKSFCDLICTFITLMKTNLETPESVIKRIPESDKRSHAFLTLLSPIFLKYQNYLISSGKIDFNDLINKSVDLVKNSKTKGSYKYIIVDEYQDIAPNRFKLLKELATNSPGCKLFVVGDDWQSIYRFGGSDISFISSFTKFFPNAAVSKIEKTYRFNEPLLSVSSSFIKANPYQITKSLIPKSDRSKTSISHHTSLEKKNDADTYMSILDSLIELDGANVKVLTLGRYNFDYYRLLPEKRETEVQVYSFTSLLGILKVIITRNAENKNDIKIEFKSSKHNLIITSEFLTVHRAKGLGEDYVIVLNCNNDILGFPSLLSDDPVQLYLLSTEDSFLHSEERRLFYVALTRAKKGVHLISSKYSPSPFLADLALTSDQNKHMCPKCLKYELVVKSSGTDRNGDPYNILGCVNYELGCTQTKYINLSNKQTVI